MSTPAPTESAAPAPLRLKRNEERRLRAGHLWIFSNEVDVGRTPLTAFTPGQTVTVEAADGRAVGVGYVNPRSLICARILSRDPARVPGRSLLVHRINVALALRERLYAEPFYRLLHGEGDGVPGLVVDRYGDVLVAQFTTAGIECLRAEVVSALQKVLSPRAILLRNDGAIRELEGLDRYVEAAFGEVPDGVEVRENGVRFGVALRGGQKTGWYFDQRDNRARLAPLTAGRSVLDLFCYDGGWGVQAAAAGARGVVCVDSSAQALERVERNARLNGVADRVAVRAGDVFEVLRELRAARERFDVVIVDPPAFIKRRRDLKAGLDAYRRLNRMAMQVLAPDGLMVSCSCSYHLPRAQLAEVLLQSARHLDRSLQVIAEGAQSADHPVHPAIPETAYLKAVFARVLPSGF